MIKKDGIAGTRDQANSVFGFVDRRMRWGLTPRGWFCVVFATFALAALVITCVYPFLAVTDRMEADIAVVEGWLDPMAMKEAAREIRSADFKMIVTTGGPSKGTGPYESEFQTVAHAAYTQLIKEGLSEKRLRRVPCEVRDWNRTYSAALAFQNWIQTNNARLDAIVILTESVHARRSRLLFQKALGPDVAVGVVSIPPSDYPSSQWWRHSAGVKDVIGESVAYLYARFFFWPPSSEKKSLNSSVSAGN